MSAPPGILAPVITADALHALLEREGVSVSERALDGSKWGAYSKTERTVYLQPGLPEQWRVSVLLHELAHVQAGHDGHQCQAIEDRIDEDVSLLLVNPGEYRFWESELGWSTGGIASALELPRWVIEAYRRVLARERFAA